MACMAMATEKKSYLPHLNLAALDVIFIGKFKPISEEMTCGLLAGNSDFFG